MVVVDLIVKLVTPGGIESHYTIQSPITSIHKYTHTKYQHKLHTLQHKLFAPFFLHTIRYSESYH